MKQVRKIESGDTVGPPKPFLWCLMRVYFAIYAAGGSTNPSEPGAWAFLSPTRPKTGSKTQNMVQNRHICFKKSSKMFKNHVFIWTGFARELAQGVRILLSRFMYPRLYPASIPSVLHILSRISSFLMDLSENIAKTLRSREVSLINQ